MVGWLEEPSREDGLSRAEASGRNLCVPRIVETPKWKKAQPSKQRLKLGADGVERKRYRDWTFRPNWKPA